MARTVACLGLGAGVGLVNGMLVGIVRLNPLIVTLAVGQIVLAWSLRYAREIANSCRCRRRCRRGRREKPLGISASSGRRRRSRSPLRSCFATPPPGRRFQAVGANPRQPGWPDSACGRTSSSRTRPPGRCTAVAAILLAGIRISIDPAFGAGYLLAPIAAVVIGGARALRRAGERDLDVGRRARAHPAHADAADPRAVDGMQYIVFGAAIIAGMLISGDRVASLLGRLLRRSKLRPATRTGRRHELRLAKGGNDEVRKAAVDTEGARWWSCCRSCCWWRRSRSPRPVSAAPARSTRRPQAPVDIGKGGGFGEVYAAKVSTLEKTLFKATLLPKDPACTQHRAGRARPRRREGQPGARAQVLEGERLQHRHGRQADASPTSSSSARTSVARCRRWSSSSRRSRTRRSARSSTRAHSQTEPGRSPTSRRRSRRRST